MKEIEHIVMVSVQHSPQAIMNGAKKKLSKELLVILPVRYSNF